MRRHLGFAAACLVSLGLATSAGADTILQFGQQNIATDFVTATSVGSTTTLSTNSTTAPGFIPVTITNLAGTPNLNLAAFEQFSNVIGGPSTVSGGQISAPFSGTITFYAAANTASQQFLQVTFTGGTFQGGIGGGSGSLNASTPTGVVNFTSQSPQVQAALLGAIGRNFSLSFSNITPVLPSSGNTLGGFVANNTGTFATVIPEPATIISSSMALLAGLGCYGWRRRKAS